MAAADLLPNESHATTNASLQARLLKFSTATSTKTADKTLFSNSALKEQAKADTDS